MDMGPTGGIGKAIDKMLYIPSDLDVSAYPNPSASAVNLEYIAPETGTLQAQFFTLDGDWFKRNIRISKKEIWRKFYSIHLGQLATLCIFCSLLTSNTAVDKLVTIIK